LTFFLQFVRAIIETKRSNPAIILILFIFEIFKGFLKTNVVI